MIQKIILWGLSLFDYSYQKKWIKFLKKNNYKSLLYSQHPPMGNSLEHKEYFDEYNTVINEEGTGTTPKINPVIDFMYRNKNDKFFVCTHFFTS